MTVIELVHTCRDRIESIDIYSVGHKNYIYNNLKPYLVYNISNFTTMKVCGWHYDRNEVHLIIMVKIEEEN